MAKNGKRIENIILLPNRATYDFGNKLSDNFFDIPWYNLQFLMLEISGS